VDDPALTIVFVAMAVLLLFMLLFLSVFLFFFRQWIRALMSGAPVSMFSILGMRLRGNPVPLLIDAYIVLRRAGVNATISEVEGAYIDHRTRVRTSDDLVGIVNSKEASERPPD
jgi:uncharacterized protein YqfA (UPF0365 family)